MRTFPRALLLLASLAPACPALAEGHLGDTIDQLMAKYVREDGPGAVVAVVQGGRLVHQKAYGLADLEHGTKMSTDCVFDLASCSKNLTAYAIMLLAERGKLSLEDDVRTWLPEIPRKDGERPIRVIDVLHMLSGLAAYQDLIDEYAGKTNEDIVRAVAAAPPDFPLGSKYEYSNTDYNLLATIVTRVSKESFGAFLRSEVFKPLGMTRTCVLEKEGQEIPGRIYGYKEADGKWVRDTEDTPGIVGDGSIFSCAEDLVKYDRALREGTLVSKEMLKRAWTSGKTDDGEPTKYGFGWGIDDDGDGGLLVDHNGSWSGTSTYFGRWVDKDYTIIVLFNSYEASWGDASQGISEAVEGK